MRKNIIFILFVLVCSSKSEGNFEDFLQKKCVEYNTKYEKVDKTNIQDEDSYYIVPLPGTSSVVNGEIVLPGVFPHMVALGYTIENGIEWVCGGTIINEKYVLTAAHCLKRRHKLNIEEVEWARLGVAKLTGKYGPYPKDYKIIQRIAHPSYEPPSKYNDIGLLQLDASIEITKYIKPICLTTKTEKEFPEYASLTAIGWGLTKPNGNRSDALQFVQLDLYPEEDCNEAYKTISPKLLKDGINQDQQICIGSNKYIPSDTCQGDSGGPLHIEDAEPDGHLYQLGIVTFGKSCGLKKSPGVYIRVSYYLPWIKSIVWPNE